MCFQLYLTNVGILLDVGCIKTFCEEGNFFLRTSALIEVSLVMGNGTEVWLAQVNYIYSNEILFYCILQDRQRKYQNLFQPVFICFNYFSQFVLHVCFSYSAFILTVGSTSLLKHKG